MSHAFFFENHDFARSDVVDFSVNADQVHVEKIEEEARISDNDTALDVVSHDREETGELRETGESRSCKENMGMQGMGKGPRNIIDVGNADVEGMHGANGSKGMSKSRLANARRDMDSDMEKMGIMGMSTQGNEHNEQHVTHALPASTETFVNSDVQVARPATRPLVQKTSDQWERIRQEASGRLLGIDAVVVDAEPSLRQTIPNSDPNKLSTNSRWRCRAKLAMPESWATEIPEVKTKELENVPMRETKIFDTDEPSVVSQSTQTEGLSFHGLQASDEPEVMEWEPPVEQEPPGIAKIIHDDNDNFIQDYNFTGQERPDMPTVVDEGQEEMDPELSKVIVGLMNEEDESHIEPDPMVVCIACGGSGRVLFGYECVLCDVIGSFEEVPVEKVQNIFDAERLLLRELSRHKNGSSSAALPVICRPAAGVKDVKLESVDGQRTDQEDPEWELVCAVGDKEPSHQPRPGRDWKKIRICHDSGSTVDVMPDEELCEVDTTPCTGPRAGRNMFAANGTRIESKGEKKFKAITDDGFPLDCAFISGAVKKILKSTALTCDEGGDKGQWVIHTKTGGWIVNCKTKRKIPFKRVGNSYCMDAWVQVPKQKRRNEDDMEVDNANGKKLGFTRQSRP